MNIKIICVGKIKEKYLVDALAEYKKRISRFAKLEIIELHDEKTPTNASEKEQEQIKEKEGDAILNAIKDEYYLITLCVEGKQISSEELSQHIEKLGVDGVSNIAFVIGGSLGLDERVKKISNLRLSFSKLTFPHQLMRVILLEQVYRIYKIMCGESYHK